MLRDRAKRAAAAILVSVSAISLVLASRMRIAHGDPPVDDGVPSGTVAFFGAGTSCPAGWAIATQVQGRAIVGVTDGAQGGITVGMPLGDREDRTHTHAFTGDVTLTERGIAAANGSNNSAANAQTYTVTGSTDPATSGAPFIQLRACVKQ
jgi:hypothetical protein